MKNISLALTCALAALSLSSTAAAQQVEAGNRSILEVAPTIETRGICLVARASVPMARRWSS